MNKKQDCRNNLRISHKIFVCLCSNSRLSNMRLCALLHVVTFLSSFYHYVIGSSLPDPKFMADLVIYLSRLGIIYHLPPMKQSEIFKYRKSLSQYR